jgi:hypothetical protein
MKIRALICVTTAVAALAFGGACGSSTGTGGGGTGATAGNGGGNPGAGGGTACTMSCADAITNGGTPCSSDAAGMTAYDALKTCAATSCATECATFLSGGMSLDSDTTCPPCVMMSCSTQSTDCSNN